MTDITEHGLSQRTHHSEHWWNLYSTEVLLVSLDHMRQNFLCTCSRIGGSIRMSVRIGVLTSCTTARSLFAAETDTICTISPPPPPPPPCLSLSVSLSLSLLFSSLLLLFSFLLSFFLRFFISFFLSCLPSCSLSCSLFLLQLFSLHFFGGVGWGWGLDIGLYQQSFNGTSTEKRISVKSEGNIIHNTSVLVWSLSSTLHMKW